MNNKQFFLQKNRKGLEMSFAWLFAIIVGAVILFLAIYTSTRIVNTQQVSLDAKTAKEFGVLLDPLETSFETGKSNSMTLPVETRVYNRCDNNGNFGRQIIKVSQKSFNKWTETDVNVAFRNKIIFSEDYVEGKKLLIFSKPFNFPYKVADLIYVTSTDKKYCFINPPTEIKNEISNLNQENLFLENCPANSVKVCFDSSNCKINVNYGAGYVDKNGTKSYFYTNALMYAAIFSDKEVYDCQIKRVMQRANQLSSLYQSKADIISVKGCNSNLNSDLSGLSSSETSFSKSEDLNNMISLVENIDSKNKIAECRLW